MKFRYNGQEMEVDEIRVDRYYRHIKSNTYWKLHSIQATPVGNVMDLELVNEYGDVKNAELVINDVGLYVKVGAFEEISKSEFERRKVR